MVLSKDFQDFIRLLHGKGVEYLVVGGYAVAFHGHPRYTKDMDIWLWPSPANIVAFLDALKEFGFGSLSLAVEDFANPNNVIQLGYEPNRIDILTELSGEDFKTCYANRQEVVVEETLVSFIGLDDLIMVKQKAGRLQDQADVQKLLKVAKKKKG